MLLPHLLKLLMPHRPVMLPVIVIPARSVHDNLLLALGAARPVNPSSLIRDRLARNLRLAQRQARDFRISCRGSERRPLFSSSSDAIQLVNNQFLRVQGPHFLFVFRGLVPFRVGRFRLVDFHRARFALFGEIEVRFVPFEARVVRVVVGVVLGGVMIARCG